MKNTQYPVLNNQNCVIITQEKAESFGQHLINLRLDGMGLSRVEAVASIKCSYGYLTNIELGREKERCSKTCGFTTYYSMPSRKILKKIARAYREVTTYRELLLLAGYSVPKHLK